MMTLQQRRFHLLTAHCQCRTTQIPFSMTIIKVHLEHVCYPRSRRRRGRGLPNSVPLDDEHWDMEEIPDRPLCIHRHSLPHRLCPYLCPYLDYQASSYYDALDLSDISKFEDLMTTHPAMKTSLHLMILDTDKDCG